MALALTGCATPGPVDAPAQPAPAPPAVPQARPAPAPAQPAVLAKIAPPPAAAPAIPQSPAPAEGVPEPAGDSVFFAFGSDEVEPDFRPLLARVAKEALARPLSRIRLEAHTDDRGSREFNLALAQRRAQRVEAALAELGVPALRVLVQCYGEELAQGSGRVRRRVDLRVEHSDDFEPAAVQPAAAKRRP